MDLPDELTQLFSGRTVSSTSATSGGPISDVRAILSALLLSLATLHTATAAPCMTHEEKSAFDMRALQSQLMIVVLHCSGGGYNAFMQQHQAELNDAYRTIGSYFARVNRTSGEEERDAYITQLANAQEELGLHRADFCVSMQGFVSRSLAIHSVEEVPVLMMRSGTNLDRLQVCQEGRLALPGATHTPSAGTVPGVTKRPEATWERLNDILAEIASHAPSPTGRGADANDLVNDLITTVTSRGN